MPQQQTGGQQARQQLPTRTRLRAGAGGSLVWLIPVDRFRERGMLKVLLAALLAATVVSGLILFAINMLDSGLTAALVFLLQYLALGGAAAVVLALAGFFLLYIPLVGRRHHVIYELREDGILQVFVRRGAQRADIRADLAALTGGAAEATALRTRQRHRFLPFAQVKRLRLWQEKGALRLTGADMATTQVYTYQQDFGVVSAYIMRRCRHAAIRR